jgi:hypothetical protein
MDGDVGTLYLSVGATGWVGALAQSRRHLIIDAASTSLGEVI